MKRALLIISGGRCEYFIREFESIKRKQLSYKYRIIVSVENIGLSDCMKNYLKVNFRRVNHLFYHEQKHLHDKKLVKVAKHFKYALTVAFLKLKYNICIVLEDDLIIKGDFFSYFLQTEKLFLNDHSIFAINSMNHHSHKNITFNSYNLYRMEAYNT